MNEDKILEIFKKHSVYRDSEALIKDIEMYGEDEDGEDLIFDEEFLLEEVDSYNKDNIQYIKLDFVKEIIKEAQIKVLKELDAIKTEYGVENRYRIVYEEIYKKLNKLENERNIRDTTRIN